LVEADSFFTDPGGFFFVERVERRLAAVLAADVAGYSRLMGLDEERTLTQLKTFRKTVVDPGIATHRGRIVKTTGDGMLVEFASAVDAARCAVEIQREMARETPAYRRNSGIEYRIGIHVGDIIDDNDISAMASTSQHALRESLSQAASVASDDAHRQIRGKINIAFDDIGEQALKNITEPMRAWHIRFAGVVALRSHQIRLR
jgi:adenylate cyclase